MKAARNIIWFFMIVLLLAIGWAMWRGNGWLEVDDLLSYPWFIVTLVDIYMGFVLVCLWVWFRESSILWSLLVSVLILLLGILATGLYVLLQIRRSKGNWRRFWLGIHA